MRTVVQPVCPNCGGEGVPAYAALDDHLYDAPGTWQMARCTNPTCGAYWLNPAPDPADLPIAYQGYYTHRSDDARNSRSGTVAAVRMAYVSRRLGYPRQSRLGARWLAILASFTERSHGWLYEYFYLPWTPDGRLLEIGCGSGRQLVAMRDAGWTVNGVDFDPEAVAAARSRGLDVAVGDVRDLHLEGDTFDAIVMAHVIEHVPDPVGLLTECRRLLKPGGRLISITPNARSLGHRIYKKSWRGLEPPRHIAVFTAQALRLSSMRAGLDVEGVAVTARDAANMLLASARIRDAGPSQRIAQPARGLRPPLKMHVIAALERVGDWLGLAWGEELVLTARKP